MGGSVLRGFVQNEPQGLGGMRVSFELTHKGQCQVENEAKGGGRPNGKLVESEVGR